MGTSLTTTFATSTIGAAGAAAFFSPQPVWSNAAKQTAAARGARANIRESQTLRCGFIKGDLTLRNTLIKMLRGLLPSKKAPDMKALSDPENFRVLLFGA
jgi:hypothetical protein